MKRYVMVSNWLRMQRLFVIIMFLPIAARSQTAGSNAGQSRRSHKARKAAAM